MMKSQWNNDNTTVTNQANAVHYHAPVQTFYLDHTQLAQAIGNGEPDEVITFGGIQRKTIDKLTFRLPFRMPSPPDRNFVGRTEELKIVDDYFKESTQTGIPSAIALIGAGGMGKTHIALRYAYNHQSEYTATLWVNATSEDTIRASFIGIVQILVNEQARITWPDSKPDYIRIGAKLGIPNLIDGNGVVSSRSETISDIRTAFFDWLKIPDNDKWLLIYDNADDLESFNIEEYLPSEGGGFILITSRRPDFPQVEQRDLNGLDEENAVKLLLTLAHLPYALDEVKDQAKNLVEKLGRLPLAITHAGSYIHKTKTTLEEYMSFCDKAFMALYSNKAFSVWSYHNRDTAATTWEISFSKIEKQDTEAALILLSSSFLNRDEIYETLWQHKGSTEEMLVEHRNKISLLASYSLIKIIRAGVFAIHPVIHCWARERLQPPTRNKVLENTIKILGMACQLETYKRSHGNLGFQESKQMVPHIEHLHRYIQTKIPEFFLIQALELGDKQEKWFGYIESIAGYFYSHRKPDEALIWCQCALKGIEKVLGRNHEHTLYTVNFMGDILATLGQFEKSKVYLDRAYTETKGRFGEHYFHTRTALSSIADLYFKMHNYEKALEMYERVLESQPDGCRGKSDGLAFFTVESIGETLLKLGRREEALQCFQQALTNYQKFWGPNNTYTMVVLRSIGVCLVALSRYDEAISYFTEAASGMEKEMGKDNPETLVALGAVGQCLLRQGKYNEAIEMLLQLLPNMEKVLGENNPNTLELIGAIGFCLRKQGKYQEAIPWVIREVYIRETIWGPNDRSTIKTMNDIALLYRREKKYDNALQWYMRALGSEKELDSYEGVRTMTCYNIGVLFREQGKYEDAMRWFIKTLSSQEIELGKADSSTILTLRTIGDLLEAQDNLDEAMEWRKRADTVENISAALVQEHPLVEDQTSVEG